MENRTLKQYYLKEFENTRALTEEKRQKIDVLSKDLKETNYNTGNSIFFYDIFL